MSIKKIFLLFFCLKLIIDPFTNFAYTEAQEDNFKLVKAESSPVSFNTSLLPSTITLGSLPVSFKTSNLASQIKLSSNKVSFNTSLLPNKITSFSKPVSFFLSMNADLIKLYSLPASYKLSSFTGKLIKIQSPNVSYKTFNGISIAKINATPNIGVAPQVVTFDCDGFGQELSYTWDFGDNSNKSTNPIATYKYEKPGKYQVTLTVSNAYGKTSKAIKEIEIREKNFAPEGSFAPSLTTGDIPLTITFTSMILDKENDEITYSWDFGDGNTSDKRNPTHTYTIANTYIPKLTVTDSLGAKTTITSTKLTILPKNNLPIVKINAIPNTSTLTSNVQFIGTETYDPDGEELTYLWDFGDGNTSNEINPKHEYLSAGQYTVKLTAIDPHGGKDVEEITVPVLKPLPIAIASLSETTGNAPLEVSFDASASQDYDGREVILNWDFGDGTTKTTTNTEGQIKYTYLAPGVYLVTLTAITPDNRIKKINPANIIVGPSNEIVSQVTLLEGDTKGIVGEAKVKLSASDSFDPKDGNVALKYKWLWNTKTWDTNGNLIDISEIINKEIENKNIEETFEYIFTKPGQFIPIVEIEKVDGSKSKFFGETFTITPNQGPVAIAKVISENTEGEIGLEVKFDSSLSYDPKANGGLKILTWDFGDGEKAQSISPTHIYTKEGTFTPTLVVVDNSGLIGFAQTNSIKVRSQIKTELPARKFLFQEILTTSNNTEAEQISQEELINSMINEAISNYASFDNKKPEIGPITLEPKVVNPGGTLKLTCFTRDNIAISSFGYFLFGKDEKVIEQKIIDLINKDKEQILKEEHYIEETILIPKDLTPGEYKIKLTATDSTNNQIAKINNAADLQNNKEEITLTFEVSNNSDISSITSSTIIEPIETSELTITTDLKEKLNQNKKQFVLARTNLKLQTTGFEVTNLSGVINPYVTFFPSITNSLNLSLVSEGNGTNGNIITIGVKGSLKDKYFAEWIKTNVYVNYKKVGIVDWLHAASITYTSDTPSKVVYVEFRPLDRSGKELPSTTWASSSFTFNRILLPPQITSITPQEKIAGRGAFDLAISGSNFSSGSKVYFNGNPIIPFISDSNRLISRIPASYVANIGAYSISVKNSDGSQSNIDYFVSKKNLNNPCDLNKTLPQRYKSSDLSTILNGNDTYLSNEEVIIRGNGSVSIPFCLDKTYDVKTALTVTHVNYTNSCNIVSFKLDEKFIGSKPSCKTQVFNFDNLNTSTFSPGLHKLEVSFYGSNKDNLIVGEASFENGGGPILSSINPTSVALEGIGRILEINGANFNQNTAVYLDNKLIEKKSFTNNQIKISLPDKFNNPGSKNIYLIENDKRSTILSFAIRDRLELIANSFKINPIEPFPGNSFNIELKIKDSQLNATHTAYIAAFDPDGNLLTIPNSSNNFSTISLSGTKDITGEISFKGTIPLSINSKPGNYKIIALVERSSSLGIDYSDLETYKYLASKSLGLSTNDSLISASHRLIFTPKPAIAINFGIEENNSENIGFVKVGNKIIQDNQSIKYKAEITRGKEHLTNIRFNFKSGDDRETGLVASSDASFTYENENTSSNTPITLNPRLEVFWLESITQTQIGIYNGPTVYVYPNYKPIAKAKVFTEQYPRFSTSSPLITGFIDLDSYDPNQRFSRVIDQVDSLDNTWTLYKGTIGPNEEIISTPIDAKISDDKKTFISGSLVNPGTYFARLRAQDQTGLTDTANTESVTVIQPSQKVIVFATTDPTSKKVYDPKLDTTSNGVPVQFMSEVTVLGGMPLLTYLWNFGDGTTSTELNPKHYYFDGKKSFNGLPFIDRKSVTPKLKVIARFPDGTQETWEALAGTITFNAEANFILLDIKPNTTEGLVPLTVSFMIDPQTAKAVNATIEKYEFDYGDGSTIETSSISTLNELINKTFQHTYTIPGEYTPKLTVYIKETTRKFEFNIPKITASGTGQGGVYVLDDLSTITYSNEPVVSFMLLTVFANPNDLNNSLRIKVKDEEGIETTTELDSKKEIQTISLSESKNTYYFEANDSSNQAWKSEIREIVLDTVEPLLDLTSPNESTKYINGDPLIVGNAIDKNLKHIEYQIDENPPIILETESINDSETIFYKELSDISLEAHKIKITAYDKAGNLTSKEIYLTKSGNIVKDTRFIKSPQGEIFNSLAYGRTQEKVSEEIRVGEPFKLGTQVCFRDDNKSGNINTQLHLTNLSFKDLTDGKDLTNEFISNNKTLVNQINLGFDLDGERCGDIIYESNKLNNPNYTKELFNTNNNFDITSPWKEGPYNIRFHFEDNNSSEGTYLINSQDENSVALDVDYTINVVRKPKVISNNFIPEKKTAMLNETTLISFNIVSDDDLPFSQDKLPRILKDKIIWKEKPNNSEIGLPQITDSSFITDSNDITIAKSDISFNFTPDFATTAKKKYILNIPVEFPASDSSKTPIVKDLEIPLSVTFSQSAKITSPDDGKIISDKEIFTVLVENPQGSVDKSLIHFRLTFPNQETYDFTDKEEKKLTGITNKENNFEFMTLLNFNLSKKDSLKDLFKNQTAFGKIQLQAQYSNETNIETFEGESKEYILLDNLKIKKAKLTKDKNETIKLEITLSDNTKLKENQDPIIILKAFNGSIELPLEDVCAKQAIEAEKLEKEITCLPPETTKAEVEIQRSKDFLTSFETPNLLTNPIALIADKKIETLNGQETISCSFTPNEASAGESVLFNYSTEKNNIHISKAYKDSNEDEIVKLPQELNKLYANSGSPQFTVQEEWKDSTITLEVRAQDESSTCNLRVGEKRFFSESSQETDLIKLPFINNNTANIPTDIAFGINSLSFPSNSELTLSEFKQLLKDLKLLSEDNNNGYDLETQEATYNLLNIIDKLRCTYSENIEANTSLRQQIFSEAISCGISTNNYQEYILDSIEQNLPLVILLKSLIDTLKPIGETSPEVNIGLPDSVLLRAIAIPDVTKKLLPWQIQVLWFLGLMLYHTLGHLDQKVSVQDTACIKTFGTIDRRFIIGKDLNNLDIKRTNTMVGIKIENSIIETKVIEPFPHIPDHPGFYSTCLREGTYNLQLQFNDQNTFSMSITIPTNATFHTVEPFIGGVFRKYGTNRVVEKIIESKRILDSGGGDIQTVTNPTGAGVYLTNLSLNVDASTEEIAKALRLYLPGSFEVGNPNSIGILEPQKAESYIDLAIDTRAVFFETNNDFPLQFLIPGSFLDFTNPNEKSFYILIDKFNVLGEL